jgi:hypothetical protein
MIPICYTDSAKTKRWYQKIATNEFSSAYNVLHREDGPAIAYADGTKECF